jgi:hypothetical protein
MTEEHALVGGVANAGRVTRVDGHVLRPSNPHTAAIHRFLRALRDSGFEGASNPVGVDADGRERLEFIEGEVAVPPYPGWVQRDVALESIAVLLRRFHDASWKCGLGGGPWSDEMADADATSTSGTIICHNDVCLENVVFADGAAAGLLDFDFAAPGRPVYDVAQMARMCVPIDDDVNAARLGWEPADRAARLRLVADAYGLDAAGRRELLQISAASIARGGEFVRRRVAAGDPNFIKMWDEMGGGERFDRRRRWWEEHEEQMSAALR